MPLIATKLTLTVLLKCSTFAAFSNQPLERKKRQKIQQVIVPWQLSRLANLTVIDYKKNEFADTQADPMFL